MLEILLLGAVDSDVNLVEGAKEDQRDGEGEQRNGQPERAEEFKEFPQRTLLPNRFPSLRGAHAVEWSIGLAPFELDRTEKLQEGLSLLSDEGLIAGHFEEP